MVRCEAQLDRAGKLIGGLGGEKTRWEQTIESLTVDLHNVVGDVVVASGAVAYSGVFTPLFRIDLNTAWCKNMVEINMPHTENVTITKVP